LNRTGKALEHRIRYALRKDSRIFRKSGKQLSIDNQGGYMIINAEHNYTEAGERFDMTIDDLKGWGKDDPTFQKQSLN
jgi:hypothetical protein